MDNRSEQEIRERIEATRARMGETIEQIGDRVNPDRVKRELKYRAREEFQEMKDNVKQKARHTMREMEHEVSVKGRSIWQTIRENPVPAGMVGIGLAWLMANRTTSSEVRGYGAYQDWRPSENPYRGGYGSVRYPAGGYVGDYTGYAGAGYDTSYRGGYTGDTMPRTGPDYAAEGAYRPEQSGGGVRDQAEHAAERVRDTAEHAADSVREKAAHAADTVRERASEVADRTSERVHEMQHRVEHWADQAQYRARRVEHRIENTLHENPMAAGAMAMAIGFAAGLMIPETQREHELLGRTRDRLVDRAEEQVRRVNEKARDAAREAASRAARETVDQVWPAGEGPESTSGTGR